ncbi:hypothetical protein CPB83DRAFT_549694 [Crepidotus variabilis]|uniref:Uncharacterized protein n=1 Tax=Crepidotus variabilis TaxID=179855 RepID=A0A9P6JLM0_9AGAR|nr:hypothetical protein CPB83DRAFT_549694 [Crepidotus variabilis]
MVLFAFSSNPGNGYVVSCGTDTAWQSIPEGLSDKIKATAAANDTVLSISVGKNDWFINTSSSVCCSQSGAVMTFLSSAEAQNNNIRLADIEQFVFMPNTPTGYFCATANRQMWSGLPKSMADNIRLSSSKSDIRCVAVGAGEQWIIVREDGSFAFSGISDDLAKTLKEYRAASKNIKYITFSVDKADYYFVEFEDGSTLYLFPTSWQPQIREYTNKSQDMAIEQSNRRNAGSASARMASNARSAALLDLATFNAEVQMLRNAETCARMALI